MRFDFAAFRQALPGLSPNLSTVLAAAGTSCATLMIGYVVLSGGGKSEADAEVGAKTVAVRGPVFTPVATTPAVARVGPASTVAANAVQPPMLEYTRDLTRSVQTALKRAGCYRGGIDGVWAGQTRAAMEQFTIRVNARLPVDEPDAVLLALVETHDDVSCADGADATPMETSGIETASIKSPSVVMPGERGAPTVRREAIMTRDVVLSPPATFETHGRAEHLSYADESAPSLKREDAIGDKRSASVTAEEKAADSAPALAAAPVARMPRAVKRQRPRRTSRRARSKPPSFSRSVSRSFRSISRTMNRLF